MSGAEIERTLRLGVDDLRRRYLKRKLSPVEVIDAVAARIEATEPTPNAFVTLCLDRARREAELAERNLAAGAGRALEGIPIAVKDLFDTEGVRTTYGSEMFVSHVPDADAVAVRRACEAGAILVGKTSTHEFAWGVTKDNPHHGACRNPWDHERVSGRELLRGDGGDPGWLARRPQRLSQAGFPARLAECPLGHAAVCKSLVSQDRLDKAQERFSPRG